MNYTILEADMAFRIAFIFGILIAFYAAALGIMGSIDYFYRNRSRFSILQVTTLSSILFSSVIILMGLAMLVMKEYSDLWYAIFMPGLLGLVMFSAIFFIIMRKKRMLGKN